MADKEKILSALAQLDPLDDDQWTADGAPKVDTVAELVGAAVTRKDIVESAPDFNREKAGEGDANEDEDNESDGSNEQEQTQEQGLGDGDQETSPEGGTDTEASDEEQSGDTETVTEAKSEVDEPDAEMTEAEFLAYLNTVPKEDLEDLAGALRDQKIMVDKEVEQKKELGLRIKKAINIVNLRVKQLHPNTSATAATRRFIESQNAARMDRVARRSVVLKHLSAKDIEPRAPIDAAMARKNKRGSGRPTRPLMK